MVGRTILISAMLVVTSITMLAGPANAENFYSQGPRTSMVSIGNDGHFEMFFESTLTPYMKGRSLEVMSAAFDQPTSLTMFRTLSSSLNDARLRIANAGDNNLRGNNACPTSSQITGSHPNANCFPVFITFNGFYDDWYEGTHPRAWSLICHEISHSTGLNHAPPDHGGCVGIAAQGTRDRVAAAERTHYTVEY